MKFLLLAISLLLAANIEFGLHKSLELHGDNLKADQFENLYLTNGPSINKYNTDGKLLNTYSNAGLGKISDFDISDPLRILLFYKDFNQLIFLDNTLSELRSPVNLDELEAQNTNTVCASSKNGFWLYNEFNLQLEHFDHNLKKTVKSGELSSIFKSHSPSQMIEKNNKLYINIPAIGLLIFDGFGNYIKTIPIKDKTSIQIIDQQIIYTEGNQIKTLNPKLFEESAEQLPDSIDIKKFFITNKNLYILKSDRVDIYNLIK